jgi:predicted enzyme related to lactoylglutathione lyase
MVASKRFYAAAFGWRFTDYGPDYAAIHGPDRECGGFRFSETVPKGGPLVVLYSQDPSGNELAVWSDR